MNFDELDKMGVDSSFTTGRKSNWTTSYPTKPGFYWIRKYHILGPSAAIWRNERTMAYVVPVNQGLNFWLFQDSDIYRPFDIVSAEWQGPIEPKE